MTDADTFRELEDLQAAVASANASIGQVGRAFERLTFMLARVTKEEG
jgi:hypothetical protein